MQPNSAYDQLTQQIAKWRSRRRWYNAVIWIPRGVLAALLAAVGLATVARLRPLLTNQELAIIAGGIAVVGFLISITALFWHQESLGLEAAYFDRLFQLKERVSTAVEIQNGNLTTTPEIADAQLQDTLKNAVRVNFTIALPLKLNRRDVFLLLIALGLLIAAITLDNPQETVLQTRRAVSTAIEDQAAALEALAQEVQQNPNLNDEQAAEILEPVTDALAELQNNTLSQEEAMAVLSEAEADLRALSNEFNGEDLQQRLQTAGEALANQAASQGIGEALKNGNLARAGSELAQLADELGTLSQAEQAQLAQDLAATAAALSTTDPQLAAQLNNAAAELAAGNQEAAVEHMQSAAATFQQRAQETAAAQQAQNAADQMTVGQQEIATASQSGSSQTTTNAEQNGQSQNPSAGQAGQGEGQASSGSAQGQADSQTPDTGGQGTGGSSTENIFVPDNLDLSGEEGVAIELPVECRNNPEQCGPLLNQTPTEFGQEGSSIPYSQVFGDYRNAANEALTGDYIPLGLKGFVRDYFSSLEPDN